MAKLELELCKDTFHIRDFSVRERISEPFEASVVALCENPDVDLEEVVGRGAGVAVKGSLGVLGWTGVCAHMEQLEIEASMTGRSTYFLRIVPSVWLAGQRRNHRVFQHKTTPDIVKQVLAEYRITPVFELIDTPPVHEYRVQYGESDLAFVSRLLEEAGISYYFERHVRGEAKGPGQITLDSRLVCCDNPDFNPTMGEVPYRAEPNDAERQSRFVTKVSVGHRTRPAKVTLRDYNFRNPGADLVKSSEIKLGAGEEDEEPYEHYHHIQGGSVIDLSDGGDKDRAQKEKTPVADDLSVARHDEKVLAARAQRAAEARRHAKRSVRFETNEPNVSPGQVLSIGEHPRAGAGLGAGDKLLVIESTVEGTIEGWTLSAEAVPADSRYRPRVQTPRPRVEGIQTAIVVGPPGEQIYTDEFGRVRVRFHWDREAAFDDKAACWLRVSQAWAGARYGSVLLPRVGQEVIVDFFEGDPDQPLVVGRVFNATTRTPRELPKHMTQSIWRSATSPQADGAFHEIMFDDQAGKELVFIQSQRDLLKLVKRNETERTGQDRTVIVGEGRVAAVGVEDSAEVGKQRLIKMVTVNDLHIPEMGEPDVSPGKTSMEMVDGRITLTTGDATIVLDGPTIGVHAKGGLRFSADGRLILRGGPKVFLNAASADVSTARADRKVKDVVAKPDRMIGSVERLFWTRPAALALSRKEQSVTVAAGSIQALASSPGNRPEQIAARKKVAEDFYKENGFKLRDGKRTRKMTSDEMRSQLKCIDYNDPVVAGPPPDMPGEVEQWQGPGGSQGSFYAEPGVTPGELGIGPDALDRATGEVVPKVPTKFKPSSPSPPYLRSTASPASDTWSTPGKPQHAPGGGIQYYSSEPDRVPRA